MEELAKVVALLYNLNIINVEIAVNLIDEIQRNSDDK